MIETIKDICRVPNVKIVIALRSNIHKKIFKENPFRGVQREKYNHLYLDIHWNKEQLKQLLNNRIRELMRGTYTKDSPVIEDVLPLANKKQMSGFDYLVERTFLRPRDVIDFFNKCVKYGDGKTKITREILRLAEDEYSHERLGALNDEWLENYGNVHCLYGFLKGRNNGLKVSDLNIHAGEYFMELIVDNDITKLNIELQTRFLKFGDDFNAEPLLKTILVILYEIGLIGIKLSSSNKVEYIYEAYSPIDTKDLSDSSRVYIHPMFHKALRITR